MLRKGVACKVLCWCVFASAKQHFQRCCDARCVSCPSAVVCLVNLVYETVSSQINTGGSQLPYRMRRLAWTLASRPLAQQPAGYRCWCCSSRPKLPGTAWHCVFGAGQPAVDPARQKARLQVHCCIIGITLWACLVVSHAACTWHVCCPVMFQHAHRVCLFLMSGGAGSTAASHSSPKLALCSCCMLALLPFGPGSPLPLPPTPAAATGRSCSTRPGARRVSWLVARGIT